MKRFFDWLSSKHYSLVKKPLNMILDDGGDLTNMVIDRYPISCRYQSYLEDYDRSIDCTSKSGNITNAGYQR
jgi:S-adenosylhomocysteine hydrolase